MAESGRTVARASLAGVALIAAAASLWGIDNALRAPLLEDGPTWETITIVTYEHAILVIFALPYLVVHRAAIAALTPAAWAAALVIAWGGSALATVAFTEAIDVALAAGTVLVVVLLQKTQPLFAIGAAALVLGERPRPRFGAFLLAALAGTYLLVAGVGSPGDALAGAGGRAAALALLAAALWGTGTALGRRTLQELSPPALAALRFGLALPMLLALAAWQSALAPPAGAPGGDWLRVVLVALLPGLAAMLLYYRGLRTTPASVATLAELAFPATALVVGYAFLDQAVSAAQLVGFAILWGTIALLNRAPVTVPRPRPRLAVARGR